MTATTARLEPTRRDMLFIATGAAAVVAAGSVIWPLVSQMSPDASALALASTEVDVSSIAEGAILTVKWRGKPVFVRHRTPKEIAAARAIPISQLRDPQTDQERVRQSAIAGVVHPEWLVVIGVCTHLGCVPLGHQGEYEGWFCPCHGSQYDTSGRIRKGPAPLNLSVPTYAFHEPTKLTIG
ncbi:MAG TPA: ubiquinol-cytochrome c reductase iron-sulfur subunit [Beijerinckiaceae bacterium]|nr:ubiquinol-cytochrome c reductase iron-sulfur subunit [Beijerinckiaceae bacterium]